MAQENLRKKVGQLMVFGFSHDECIDTPSAEIIELIRDYHVGGIIHFARNLGTPNEILTLNTKLQYEAKKSGQEFPLLICIDQENGVVRRLGEGTTVNPGAMLLGATKNEQLAYETGFTTGKELKALGFNWNLAPVVDVNNNPLNPVIGVRSFGEDPKFVANFAKKSMLGMQDAGILTTIKHFPGHGNTNLDSHLDLPVIDRTIEELEEVELIPFRSCIEQGADTVMSAHVYFPAIEKRNGVPATLSRAIITGILRKRLNFDGVVTTDCMEMNAISKTIGTAQGAVEALKAGVDVVMISHTPSLQKQAIEKIVEAVENNELPIERIDEAYQRVRRLKERYVSWEQTNVDVEKVSIPDYVGSQEHRELAKQITQKGVTIVKDEQLLPLDNSKSHRVCVLIQENTYLTMVEDKEFSINSLGEVIQEIHPEANVQRISKDPTANEIELLLKQANQYDTIIVGTLNAAKSTAQQTLIKKLYEQNERIVVVAMRNPYDLAWMPFIKTFIATYEFTTLALTAAAKAIYGIERVTGTLPVSIPKIEKSGDE